MINKLYIKGSHKDVDKCREFLYNSGANNEELIDFNVVMPDNEWGTKWNAYETDFKRGFILFQTAWNPPSHWFLFNLSWKFKDVKFILKSSSEFPSFGNKWKKTIIVKSGQVLKVRHIHKGTHRFYKEEPTKEEVS
jgi:hypothetical protein